MSSALRWKAGFENNKSKPLKVVGCWEKHSCNASFDANHKFYWWNSTTMKVYGTSQKKLRDDFDPWHRC